MDYTNRKNQQYLCEVNKMGYNFIECKSVTSANNVDLKMYSFVKFSENRQRYIFKIRENQKK